MRRWLPSLICVGVSGLVVAAVAFDWTPLLRGPAPYPPEWRWELRTEPTSGRYGPALACALGLIGVLAGSGSRRARRQPRAAALVLLTMGTLLGWGFSVGLVALEPLGAMRTLMGRAGSRTVTSYLRVASSSDARDPWRFLDRHAQLLPGYRKAAKHAATHPPGPVLCYRGLIALCEGSPALTRGLLRVAGLDPEGRPANRPPLTREARAAGLAGALLILLAGAATAWPVAAIAERAGIDRLSAARTGLLWTLVPGAVLMAPQLDQALALPVSLATAGLVAALQTEGPARRLGLAAAAGLVGGLAFSLSYGAAAFLLVGGLGVLALASGPGTRIGGLLSVGAVALATAASVFCLPVLVGHEPLRALRTALAIHREFYTEPRSYSLWLIFNPVDLAVFLGPPLVACLAWRAAASARAGLAGLEHRTVRFRATVLAGLALLLVSGTVRGEVGRIWIPLMPLLLIAAVAEEPGAAALSGARREPTASPTPAEATLLGGLLALLCFTLRIFWQVY